MKTRKFVDSAVLYAAAGGGGNGCMSFRREKYVPRGGPDGGDGGDGGSVILQGDRDTDSLIGIYFSPHRRAPRGGHGKGKQLYGRRGNDLIVNVPLGTQVYEKDSGELRGDITAHGQRLTVAAGGKGGRGNIHWKSATHQAPTEHTNGEPGEEANLRLELKLLSDVALVGFPNAGKSSLLMCISDAHPKVAAYPFTTLNPIIGTVVFEDYTRLRVADIPGLIAGAHEGVGLGDRFLRHVERSAALLFVLDMAGTDGRDPLADFQALRHEIGLYGPELLERPALHVANKMDLPEAAANVERFRGETGIDPLAVSAREGTGIATLRAALFQFRQKPPTGDAV